jgi:predicted XRE-type DNA-binding protein
MARVGKGRGREEEAVAVKVSSGNVFADFGVPDAEEKDIKIQLAVALNKVLERLDLPQTEIAKKLGAKQPDISSIQRYKLDGISSDRLMSFITALDFDIDIVIKNRHGNRGRIHVLAA